jgi:hypothetical protein
MRPRVTEKAAEARDFCALTRAILAVCEPFGPAHSFKLVHNRGASRVACLIELESVREQPALARALGGHVINGRVCVEIPVRADFEAARKVASLAPHSSPAEARAAAL